VPNGYLIDNEFIKLFFMKANCSFLIQEVCVFGVVKEERAEEKKTA